MNRCIDCGKILSRTRYLRCKSCKQRGKLNPMYGKKVTNKQKENLKEKLSKENSVHWKGGKPKCIDCQKELSTYKVRRCNICKNLGKNNPRYIDGRTKNPYPLEFNAKLKKEIRNRDGNKCNRCGMTKKAHYAKYNCNLDVHHIDHNKNNCKKNNLETLCKRCNIQDNSKVKE